MRDQQFDVWGLKFRKAHSSDLDVRTEKSRPSRFSEASAYTADTRMNMGMVCYGRKIGELGRHGH